MFFGLYGKNWTGPDRSWLIAFLSVPHQQVWNGTSSRLLHLEKLCLVLLCVCEKLNHAASIQLVIDLWQFLGACISPLSLIHAQVSWFCSGGCLAVTLVSVVVKTRFRGLLAACLWWWMLLNAIGGHVILTLVFVLLTSLTHILIDWLYLVVINWLSLTYSANFKSKDYTEK